MRTPCIASIAGPIFRNYRLNTDAGQDGRSTSVKKMSVGQPRDSLPVLLAGRLTQRGLFRHSYGDGRRRECDPGLSCRGQHLSRQDRTALNDETQERINCLPATFKSDGVCGVKWVSVFPPNPAKNGIQNLSAVVILSEIEHGFPIAFMHARLEHQGGCDGRAGRQVPCPRRRDDDRIYWRRRTGKDAAELIVSKFESAAVAMLCGSARPGSTIVLW